MTVQLVERGSRAEKMGVQPFDLIQKVNDAKIETVQELQKAVAGSKTVKLDVLRGGKMVKIEEK